MLTNQRGHVPEKFKSHGSIQCRWKMWEHGRTRTFSLSWKHSVQMEQFGCPGPSSLSDVSSRSSQVAREATFGGNSFWKTRPFGGSSRRTPAWYLIIGIDASWNLPMPVRCWDRIMYGVLVDRRALRGGPNWFMNPAAKIVMITNNTKRPIEIPILMLLSWLAVGGDRSTGHDQTHPKVRYATVGEGWWYLQPRADYQQIS